MKIEISEEWFKRNAALEGDLEIGAGLWAFPKYPPAYGNCHCACHRSEMLHIVACCKPEPPKFMAEEVLK